MLTETREERRIAINLHAQDGLLLWSFVAHDGGMRSTDQKVEGRCWDGGERIVWEKEVVEGLASIYVRRKAPGGQSLKISRRG
jgi:hypothetical protein